MSDDSPVPRRRALERGALVAIVLLAAGAAFVRPLWAELDATQAVADAVWDGAFDPWGHHLQGDDFGEVHSVGPDGVRQTPDDVYPARVGPTRFLYRASRLLLAFAAIALLAIVAALRKPRGRWWLEAALAFPFGVGMAVGALVLAQRLEADGLVRVNDLARTWLDPDLAIFTSATLSGAMVMFLARANLAPT